MKRTLIAAILALGIHALLLGAECNWYKGIFADKPIPRVVTITLASRQPQTPVLKIQDPLSKTPVSFKTPANMLKDQIPKPEPIKPGNDSIPLATASVVKTVDDYKAASESGRADAEPSKPIDQSSQNPSAILFVREAKPLYRTNPAPEYPRIARLKGYQGHVILKVLVDREGNVSDLELSRSSGYPVLDQAAVDSVKKWIFVPAMQGNENVEMWVRIPIRFKLE